MSRYSGYEQSFFNDRLQRFVSRLQGRGFQSFTTVLSQQSQFNLEVLLSAPRRVLRDPNTNLPFELSNPDGSFKPMVGFDSPPSV